VQFACSNLGALLPHLKSGTLRALMTTTRERLPELPEVPTATRTRLARDGEARGLVGAGGAARLPREVVQRWTDALAKLARDPAGSTATRNWAAYP
jgi:tripartite-type tricarboxylate transporter receptor subunit TctC